MHLEIFNQTGFEQELEIEPRGGSQDFIPFKLVCTCQERDGLAYRCHNRHITQWQQTSPLTQQGWYWAPGSAGGSEELVKLRN